MSEHFLNIKSFLGTDNTSDLTAVSVQTRKAGIFFYEIDNIDIDDHGKPHRRKGNGDAIFGGSNVRSLWANDKICLFASGAYFKKLNTDYSITNLIENVDRTDPFCYVEHGELVFFSNNSIVGYIDTVTGLPYPFPDPNQTYKTRMVGGQILEFYNNRLYAANDSNLFFSDATVPTMMDTRKNAIAFPDRITMVKAVDDGIYVSDSKHVYFESGGDPGSFVEIKKLDIPAIEGMSVATDVRKLKRDRKAVYWVTKMGIYAGYNEGAVVQQQGGLFHVDDLESGMAIIKDGAYQQLLTIGKLKVGTGGSAGTYKLPTPIETATGESEMIGSSSASPSVSPSLSPSASVSPSESPSVSPSLSPSASPSGSPSTSPSESQSLSPSASVSLSESSSLSPSVSPSTSPSVSPSASPSVSPSLSPSI